MEKFYPSEFIVASYRVLRCYDAFQHGLGLSITAFR
jgi:hypothetical protein